MNQELTKYYDRFIIHLGSDAFIIVDEKIKAQSEIKYINPEYQFNQPQLRA